jgi:hypothetical protein
MSGDEVSIVPEATARGYYGPDGQPQFFSDPAMDRFVSVLVKLTQELWVVSERLDGLERAVLAKGTLSRDDLDAVARDPAANAERDAALGAYVHRTLAALREPS